MGMLTKSLSEEKGRKIFEPFTGWPVRCFCNLKTMVKIKFEACLGLQRGKPDK